MAFPTETVYGLGANALSGHAVEKIFAAKQRPDWDPLIVHIAAATKAERDQKLHQIVTGVSDRDQAVMNAFWPGPLTMQLPRSAAIPDAVTAGRPLVVLRMPEHPVARALLALTALPLAAPSANSFGRTSPTSAEHVLEDLDGRIDAVLDSGPTTLGLESAVVDANALPPVLYRHGMVPFEQLQQILPDLVAYSDLSRAVMPAKPEALPSPGVGIRHYAPLARLVLVKHSELAATLRLTASLASTGVMLPQGSSMEVPETVRVFSWGSWADAEQLAQRLFAGLRALDAAGVQVIVCPVPEGAGLSATLRDRLEKAARPQQSHNERWLHG